VPQGFELFLAGFDVLVDLVGNPLPDRVPCVLNAFADAVPNIAYGLAVCVKVRFGLIPLI
jgi:hypothetical protein